MSSKGKKHIHKYHKVQLSYGPVWACGETDCSHHMPQHMTELMLGKKSRCWNCYDIITLDELNMKSDLPLCNDCKLIEETKPTIEQFVTENLESK